MPPGFCTEYDITNNNGYTVTINYTPCDGSATSFDLAGGASTTVCADSLGIPETDGGIDPSVDIEEGGSCTASASPTPSRTPSNTPAAASVSRTPSVTVTRTVTPSISVTPSTTVSRTPSSTPAALDCQRYSLENTSGTAAIVNITIATMVIVKVQQVNQ